MKNNLLKNYLIQTQQLFGNNLILSTNETNFPIIEEGNPNSKILFIKEFVDDEILYKKEKKLFSKILKALNLSYDKIFLMSHLKDAKNNFSNSFKRIKPLVIVILGSSISEFFCSNNYKGIKIISTYSLIDILNNSTYKKYVWNDLKPILDIIN